jgi:hypothetical protein
MNAPTTLDAERCRRAICLLQAAGLRGPLRWTPLTGGANNRVFRIDGAASTVLLKAYYVHPHDPRDRLGTDFGFSQFAWNHGVRALARPIACDAAGHLAAFEHLPGMRILPEDVTGSHVREALDFFQAINEHRAAAEAAALGPASEACFTLRDHLECVRRRVARLQFIEEKSHVDRAACDLVRGELAELSDAVLSRARDQAVDLGLALDESIPVADRCLSPSDFGFHNALRMDDGRLKFIDFEYAGWDDPAKLVADFFCQPQIPVPIEFFEDVAAAIVRHAGAAGFHVQRCRLLLPVYRLKWCCIMLNDFLATGGRRHFAGSAVDEEERKARQLARVQVCLAAVRGTEVLQTAAR